MEAYCQDCMNYGLWVHRQRTAEELEIKFNTVGCRETCVICTTSFRPEMICLWPFVRGTGTVATLLGVIVFKIAGYRRAGGTAPIES